MYNKTIYLSDNLLYHLIAVLTLICNQFDTFMFIDIGRYGVHSLDYSNESNYLVLLFSYYVER